MRPLVAEQLLPGPAERTGEQLAVEVTWLLVVVDPATHQREQAFRLGKRLADGGGLAAQLRYEPHPRPAQLLEDRPKGVAAACHALLPTATSSCVRCSSRH